MLLGLFLGTRPFLSPSPFPSPPTILLAASSLPLHRHPPTWPQPIKPRACVPSYRPGHRGGGHSGTAILPGAILSPAVHPFLAAGWGSGSVQHPHGGVSPDTGSPCEETVTCCPHHTQCLATPTPPWAFWDTVLTEMSLSFGLFQKLSHFSCSRSFSNLSHFHPSHLPNPQEAGCVPLSLGNQTTPNGRTPLCRPFSWPGFLSFHS